MIDKDVRRRVRDAINEEIKKRGIDMSKAALLLGVSKTYLYNIINMNVPFKSYELRKAICRFTRRTKTELFKEGGDVDEVVE